MESLKILIAHHDAGIVSLGERQLLLSFGELVRVQSVETEERFWQLLETQQPHLVFLNPSLVHAMTGQDVDAARMQDVILGMVKGKTIYRQVILLSGARPPWNTKDVGADGFFCLPAKQEKWSNAVSLLFPLIGWERERTQLK